MKVAHLLCSCSNFTDLYISMQYRSRERLGALPTIPVIQNSNLTVRLEIDAQDTQNIGIDAINHLFSLRPRKFVLWTTRMSNENLERLWQLLPTSPETEIMCFHDRCPVTFNVTTYMQQQIVQKRTIQRYIIRGLERQSQIWFPNVTYWILAETTADEVSKRYSPIDMCNTEEVLFLPRETQVI